MPSLVVNVSAAMRYSPPKIIEPKIDKNAGSGSGHCQTPAMIIDRIDPSRCAFLRPAAIRSASP